VGDGRRGEGGCGGSCGEDGRREQGGGGVEKVVVAGELVVVETVVVAGEIMAREAQRHKQMLWLIMAILFLECGFVTNDKGP
jgi:hypothetical protein